MTTGSSSRVGGSAPWWRALCERSGAVRVETAGLLPDGWREWALWCEVCAEASTDCRGPVPCPS